MATKTKKSKTPPKAGGKRSGQTAQLSDQQRLLVDCYFGAANFNKSKALRMAGYNHHNYLRIFDKPAIAAEVEKRHARNRKKYEVTYERVAEEIAKIAFSNVLDYCEVDPKTGDLLVRFNEADAAGLAAIAEVTVEYYTEGRGEDAVEVKRLRVKPYNKLSALDALMRHAGISKDKGNEALVNLAERLTAARTRAGLKDGENQG